MVLAACRTADQVCAHPRGNPFGVSPFELGLGEKVAVHRDEQGEMHAVSAICTHLGCDVEWNGTERTWDCPCHGSRFDHLGAVIQGPATEDLPPWSAQDD